MRINSITPSFRGSISTVYQDSRITRSITFNTNSIAFSYGISSDGRRNGTTVYLGNKEFFVPHSYMEFSDAFEKANKDNETHIDLETVSKTKKYTL